MTRYTPIGEVERALFVTVEEAAAMGQRPMSFFERLVHGGRVPVLWGSLSAESPPVPLLSVAFARQVATTAEDVIGEDVETSVLMRVRFWVLEYVKALPPERQYDTAVAWKRPFVARAGSRWGAEHAHIQVRFLVEFLRMSQAPLDDRLESRLKPALRALGAVSMGNGVRDEAGRLRGRSWWRLPVSMWRAGPGPSGVVGPADLVPVAESGFEDDVSGVEPVEESE